MSDGERVKEKVAAAEPALEEASDAQSPPATPIERGLLERLRAGDERAFTELLHRYHGPLRRVARLFVSTSASADELVQETWVAVIEGLRGFEGRSSLKTWIFRILANRAKTRGIRERRSVTFSSMGGDDAAEAAVDPERFDERGTWQAPPGRWEDRTPEGLLLRKEAAQAIEAALESLPQRQRIIVTLRDIEGWSSEEVCNVLSIMETNQRVLLHRARSRLRQALEKSLGGRE
jgi:RNA polymerase sigma-70 factor, ECF subfamily